MVEDRLEFPRDFINVITAVFKFIAFVALMLFFILHQSLYFILLSNPLRREHYLLRSISGYSKLALNLLNVEIKHHRLGSSVEGALIISNHLSYLDVLVLAVYYPSFFVTSVEIRETFLLGHISRMAGCFFVERRKSKITPGTKEAELLKMKNSLRRGNNVFLFPEGTSSDGQKVLPFKATFFQLASDLDIPVIPLCLKYVGSSSQVVPWYGDMTFPDHLLKLCLSNSIEVELIQLPKLMGNDKFKLAQAAHESISGCYG